MLREPRKAAWFLLFVSALAIWEATDRRLGSERTLPKDLFGQMREYSFRAGHRGVATLARRKYAKDDVTGNPPR